MVGDMLPIKADLTVSARSLLTAVAYGLLVSLLFTLWPLGRAEQMRAGVLFRDEVAPERVLPRSAHHRPDARRPALLLAALAMLTSEARQARALLLPGRGRRVRGVPGRSAAPSPGRARRMPRPRRPELALAIGNLGAPGGLTRSVVLSLGRRPVAARHRGAGRSLHHRRADRPPAGGEPQLLRARRQARRDRRLACAGRASEAPAGRVREAPMLRGRIVKLGDRAAETRQGAAGGAMGAQRRPRAVLFRRPCRTAPRVVAGQWWPADYAGEPLVSFEAEIAKGLGLKIGDTVTVNVLGRNVTARDRQPARGEVGEPGAQLRPGFLAQYPGRRAAQPAGDDLAAQGHAARHRGQAAPSRSAAPSRPPPPSASRTPSTPSTPSSAASCWPCGRPAASPCSPAPWCWPAPWRPPSAAASSRR